MSVSDNFAYGQSPLNSDEEKDGHGQNSESGIHEEEEPPVLQRNQHSHPIGTPAEDTAFGARYRYAAETTSSSSSTASIDARVIESQREGDVKVNTRCGLVRVPENTVYIVERAGRYHRVLHSGMRYVLPGVDKVRYAFTRKHQKLELETAHAPTADNVLVCVRAVLYYIVSSSVSFSEFTMLLFFFPLSVFASCLAARVM